MRTILFTLILLAVLVSGCGSANPVNQEIALSGPGTPQPATLAANPTLPASTPASENPVATASATGTPVPTGTLVPATPTPTLFPMMIEAQRLTPHPGSPITIERELERGVNYSRYYAYYLSDGFKIYALLTIPDGEIHPGGWPAIVFNHGYIPPDVYRTTERYVAYVDQLARAGYIVFRIDYRGHDQSEGESRGAYGDPGYLSDVLNAVASLQQLPQANPQKIGMWGHSMGGYLTLRSMTISPDIKAGVIWAGVVGSYPDMISRWRRRSGPTPTPPAFSRRWRDAWIAEFGSPEQNPQFWAAVSANSYLGDLSGPLQLHHGTADEDVPLVFSETLAVQLQAAGKPYEFYTYEGDNHNISNYFSQAMQRTVAFYDQYLK